MRQAGAQHKIDKKLIVAMSGFAIRNIPGTDADTLNKFLELVHITGSYGWLSDRQLVEKMRIMVEYVPGTNIHSLLLLAELLSMYLPLKIRCGRDRDVFVLAEPHTHD